MTADFYDYLGWFWPTNGLALNRYWVDWSGAVMPYCEDVETRRLLGPQAW